MEYIIVITHEDNSGGQIVYDVKEDATEAFAKFEKEFEGTTTKLTKKVKK